MQSFWFPVSTCLEVDIAMNQAPSPCPWIGVPPPLPLQRGYDQVNRC